MATTVVMLAEFDGTGVDYGFDGVGVTGATATGAGVDGAETGAASCLAAAGAAIGAPAAPGVMSTKGAPTGTVSPSAQWYLVMTPEKAAMISTVTLSVSILAITSSA